MMLLKSRVYLWVKLNNESARSKPSHASSNIILFTGRNTTQVKCVHVRSYVMKTNFFFDFPKESTYVHVIYYDQPILFED